MIRLSLWVAVLVCSAVLPRNLMAGALDNWHVRNSSNSIVDLIFANDLFVAVGGWLSAPIMTSPDGVTWTLRLAETVAGPKSIAYGNGRFVVTAGGGTNLTSTDGVTWNSIHSGTSSELSDLTFGNGQFVAVGRNATLLTSADGLNWTSRDSHGVSGGLVNFGDGKFLVYGQGTNLISADGVNWTPATAPRGPYCLGFGNGTWVIVDGGNTVWTSYDAVNWTRRDRLEIVRPLGIHYAYGTWVMVGSKILSSRDAITWTEHMSNSSSFGYPLFALTAGHHTFVAGGYQRILQSDPIVNLEVRRGNSRQLILSAPLDRAARIEFSETVAGEWRSLGTVTPDSDPYILPIDPKSATGFYRAVLLQQ